MLFRQLRLKLAACVGSLVLVHVTIGALTAAEQAVPLAMYRRIHVQDRAEYPLLYTLLESYITSPETAGSVREVVFRPTPPREGCFFSARPAVEEWVDVEVARRVSNDSIFYQGVEQLSLSPGEKERWVKVLTWMDPEVRAQRKSPEDRDAQEYFDKFVREHDHEFVNCATALLMTLCPNIERLVYGDNEWLNPVKMVLRRNNYGALPAMYLQNLKDVVLLGTDDYLFGDERFYVRVDILDLVRMVHRLPKIESISADAMDSPHEYEVKLPAGTSNIKKINITHSVFGSDVLAPLIRAPKALEELTITTGGRATNDGTALMIGEEIGKALLCQKNSLVKLELDLGWVRPSLPTYDWDEPDDYEIDMYEGEWKQLALNEAKIDKEEGKSLEEAMSLPTDRSYEGSIGSLHDFERLTHLNLNVQHFGYSARGVSPAIPSPSHRLVDALPPNLEYLLLRGYEKGVYEELDGQVAEFLEVRSERFPSLKQVNGIDEFVSSGEHVERPDEHGHLLWKADDVDTTWHLHTHDEL